MLELTDSTLSPCPGLLRLVLDGHARTYVRFSLRPVRNVHPVWHSL